MRPSFVSSVLFTQHVHAAQSTCFRQENFRLCFYVRLCEAPLCVRTLYTKGPRPLTFDEVLHQLLQICISKIEIVESKLNISVNVKFGKLKDLLATLPMKPLE